MSAQTAATLERERWPYRMKDLCELTGLSRQAIHFYIQQGLLPEGFKTGRNMAYYGEDHLDRLRLIQKLQHERFLPLKAIKAILEDSTHSFEPSQRAMLVELKSRLSTTLASESDHPTTTEVAPLLAELGVREDELRRMAELGLIGLVEQPTGTLRIARSDVRILEMWSQMRSIGFAEELGFTVEDLALYETTVSELFRREVALILERLKGQPVERVAAMIEKALPVIHAFFDHYHAQQVRNFFAAME
jgi:DNA-binding transcriptional MerR regulator